ncbi:uncharacterized protein LOC141643517 isoform X2 [Silene latifolia]|uniref:uncharacterized protein LOC141643517 isoform X2 n=1 Tax=Silene latifolia TaxID=37657 RepID=UPI003D77502F
MNYLMIIQRFVQNYQSFVFGLPHLLLMWKRTSWKFKFKILLILSPMVQHLLHLFKSLMSSQKNKEFLFYIIDKVDNPEVKKEALIRLKSLVIKDKDMSTSIPTTEPFSISKLFNKYPEASVRSKASLDLTASPVKIMQQEINSLKVQVNEIKKYLENLEIRDHDIQSRLTALEALKDVSKGKSSVNSLELSLSETLQESPIKITSLEPNESFIKAIDRINFQKWYYVVTFKVKDFTINLIALKDSGADQNCVNDGIIPPKYYGKTNIKLYGANGSPLNIKHKISKAKILNEDYCFKNSFTVVRNIQEDIILGTPFLTQIYHFHVDDKGLHTNIMGKTLSFKCLSPITQKDITLLQSSTIYQNIDSIHQKRKLIMNLKEEISYA